MRRRRKDGQLEMGLYVTPGGLMERKKRDTRYEGSAEGKGPEEEEEPREQEQRTRRVIREDDERF